MRRIRMSRFTLLTRDRSTYEIEVGGTVVGRVLWEREPDPITDEDDILVTDYSTDIDEDGSYGGTYLTSIDDAWSWVGKHWEKDISEALDHQAGKHRSTQRRPEQCLVCKDILRLAREWQAADAWVRDQGLTDEEVVGRYLFHAQKMSES